MTANQIARWQAEELARHNRATEAETKRYNLAAQEETRRANRALEYNKDQDQTLNLVTSIWDRLVVDPAKHSPISIKTGFGQ